MHFDACIKGAHRGVDLFVEKPGIVNNCQFNPLSQAVIQNKVGFFVSFQRRFHPLTLRIKQLLDSNALGRILNVNIQVHSFYLVGTPTNPLLICMLVVKILVEV